MIIETADIKPATATSHGVERTAEREAFARQRMEAYIRERRDRAAATLELIRTVVPTDFVVPADAIDFKTDLGKLDYIAPKIGRQGLHRNALTQLAGRLNIPVAYIDHLVGAQEKDGDQVNRWGLDLLADVLRRHVTHTDDRYLIRTVAGEARAVLSDKFKRIDCRPGALGLIEAARSNGLIVSDGTFTDTRSSLKFIRPTAIEVFPGEFMVFGFEWSNSDYGRGASDLRMFFWRTWCWNGATGESVVRQIHIGRRLNDDIELAQDTLEAEAKHSALLLRDAAATAMSETKLQRMIAGIQAANAIKIDPKTKAESIKKALNKGEVEAVVQAFNSPDVENMPAGNTLWRWSNAISWVGGQTEDADRRLDFERLAGEVMKPAMPKEADKAA